MENLQDRINQSIFVKENISFDLHGMSYKTSGKIVQENNMYFTRVKDSNGLVINLKLDTFILNNAKMTYTTRLSLL